MNVVIFDGLCNLCNKFVNLALRRDKKRIFKFSQIGSEFSRGVEEKYGVDLIKLDTLVLVQNQGVFIKSDAVIRIFRHLGYPYSFVMVFYLLPKFLRNNIYDLIARNRYEFFGKRESCQIPGPDVINRFI